MLRDKSPLRYPGGKSILSKFLREVIVNNNLKGGTYFELYAGGAGAALDLLYSNTVNRIVLNDADFHIYALWKSMLDNSDAFIDKIEAINVDLNEWYKQHEIYENFRNHTLDDVGFSAFFLNRCNRSGILTKAGPIGGFEQNGNYKIDARFNKANLIERVKMIRTFSGNIEIYNCDTIDFIKKNKKLLENPNSFMYLDPPYYKKGKSLYLNYYVHSDHEQLRDILTCIRHCNWLVSYDNVQEIQDLYSDFQNCIIELSYSLQAKRKTTEFCIYSDSIEINE